MFFAAVPALNFHKYTHSTGYVSGPEPTFLRVVYTPFIEYICQRFRGRHTQYIEYALRRSRLPVDCKHAQFIGYISRQFPEPYFVKYTHYTVYVLRLFCTLALHLISQNIPHILSISSKKQGILIFLIYRVCLRSLRTIFTSAYTLYTGYIPAPQPADPRKPNIPII